MIDSMAVGMAGREGPRPASYFFRAPAPERQQKSLCEAGPKTPKAHDENAERRAPKLRRGCELNVSITRVSQDGVIKNQTRGIRRALSMRISARPLGAERVRGKPHFYFTVSTIWYRHQGRHPVPEPVGTWGKMESRERNEFVCCVSRDGARRGSSHDSLRRPVATIDSLIRAGQKFYMSERCGWIQGAGSLLILGSTCIEMSRSPGCL